MIRRLSLVPKALLAVGILVVSQPALARKHAVHVPEFDSGAAGVAAVLVIGGALMLARNRKAR